MLRWAASPRAAVRALAVIEAAGTEALEETQRLSGLLLSPDGTPLPEPEPGLADLDYLAAQVSEAGLPVDTRVEGGPCRSRLTSTPSPTGSSTRP